MCMTVAIEQREELTQIRILITQITEDALFLSLYTKQKLPMPSIPSFPPSLECWTQPLSLRLRGFLIRNRTHLSLAPRRAAPGAAPSYCTQEAPAG